MTSAAPPTPGFVTAPLTDTHNHMASGDGVVVGMLTSSPQEEGMCRCGLLNSLRSTMYETNAID